MAGRFYHLPGTAFMVILFALVVIQRIDGTPYQLPGYYSYDEETQPVAAESPKHPGFTLSGSKDPRDSAEMAAKVKTIHYSKSSASYEDGRGESRVIEISQQERATRLDDEERSIHEDFDRDAAENDGEYDDDDDDDDDNDNNNNNQNNNTDNTEDEITQLIDEALHDDIFLSPKKWASWLGSSNDGSTSVKVQKTRSPQPSPNIVTKTTGHHIQTDRIVFPDEYPSRRHNSVIGRPVPSCANSTFCLEPEYYLSDTDIDNALKLRYIDPISEPSTISERMGPSDNGIDLCRSNLQTLTPKSIKSDDNAWYWILNNQKYVQSVRVEICESEDAPCNLIEGFSSGYKTICKQKYVYRQLVALKSVGGEPLTKSFPIQSSCCCHVTFTGEPEMRLGVSLHKSNQQSPIPERN